MIHTNCIKKKKIFKKVGTGLHPAGHKRSVGGSWITDIQALPGNQMPPRSFASVETITR